MFGKNEKFKEGHSYFGKDNSEIIMCVKKEDDYSFFMYYRNQKLIKALKVYDDEICNDIDDNEFFYINEDENEVCNSMYCRETVTQDGKELLKIMTLKEDADVFEIYHNSLDFYIFKIARRKYTKPHYFVVKTIDFETYGDFEAISEERANLIIEEERLHLWSLNDAQLTNTMKHFIYSVIDMELFGDYLGNLKKYLPSTVG